MTLPHDIRENPFCSRRIRPGAVPFLFPPDQNAETLVELLEQNHWWGEIIGPHGSGKSSLLASLIPVIERAGRPVVLVELHDGQRQLPIRLGDARLQSPAVVIVDGYEQLSRWNRFWLKRHCRRHLGLLATSHVSVGLPEIYRTAVTPELAARIVALLLDGRTPPPSEAELTDCISRHAGNLREVLFELYDVCE
jgi:hypothetical protein